jgi:RHS repeat-associated protein
LDYFGARYFSGAQGRFTSPDWSSSPAAVPYAELGDPQTLNLYVYVRNNPLRLNDPTGHSFLDKLGNWLTGGGWNEDEEAKRVRAESARQWQQMEIRTAREYFSQNATAINGQIVDPDKTPDTEVVNAYWQAMDARRTGDGMTAPIDPGQLQAKFKHAEDFGVKGNWNKQTAQEFEEAVQQHIDDPSTQVIKGTYRGQSVIHHVNPQTGLNVMTDPSGKFISGWKLGTEQLRNVLTRGTL